MTEPLVVGWQAADAAADVRALAPEWLARSGSPLDIRELEWDDLYAEPLSSPEAFDVVRIAPAWLPDMVESGVVAPLEPTPETEHDLLDYHPLYRSVGVHEGVRYGLFDDGDCLLLYSRQEFLDAVGREPPATWEEFTIIAAEVSDALGPAVYGAAPWTATYGHLVFMGRLRANGGRFFDPATMRAEIDSAIAATTLQELTGFGRGAVPGSARWSPGDVVNPWLRREVAMTYWWPPLARWSAGAACGSGARDDALVTPFPDPAAEIAGGAVLCLTGRGARHPEAAALICWLVSPDVSLRRTLVDAARTDPYRLSHFDSPVARAVRHGAGAQLDCCRAAADRGLIDLALPAAQEYMRELQRAIDGAAAGRPVEDALRDCAAAWDAITARLGVDRMRLAYLSFLEQPGATLSPALAGSVSKQR
jgi:multiple sugar transport system substrate-binding protein